MGVCIKSAYHTTQVLASVSHLETSLASDRAGGVVIAWLATWSSIADVGAVSPGDACAVLDRHWGLMIAAATGVGVWCGAAHAGQHKGSSGKGEGQFHHGW